jgi:hypothetical protein
VATTRIEKPWGLFFCNGSTRPSFAGSSSGDTEAVYLIYFDPIEVDSTTYVISGTPTVKAINTFRRSDIVDIESNVVQITNNPYNMPVVATLLATLKLSNGQNITLDWSQAYVNFLSGSTQADADYWNFLVTATTVNNIRYGLRPSAAGTITTISGYLSSSAFFERTFSASGSSFPANPVTNDLFFNTIYGALFFWDGTHWAAPYVNIHQSGAALAVGNTTSEVLLVAVLLPRELMQANSEIVYDYLLSGTVGPNDKTLIWAVADNALGTTNRVNISGTAVYTTQPLRKQNRKIVFRNSLSAQIVTGVATDDLSAGTNNAAAGLVLTKNFASADFYLCAFGTKEVGAEILSLNYLRVSIINK